MRCAPLGFVAGRVLGSYQRPQVTHLSHQLAIFCAQRVQLPKGVRADRRVWLKVKGSGVATQEVEEVDDASHRSGLFFSAERWGKWRL